MKQILQVHGLSKETLTSLMVLYKNMKAMIHLSDSENDIFDIFAGDLQRDTLAPYMFLIGLDYILYTSTNLIKEKGITLKKMTRSRQYASETMTDADNADDQALLANMPAQAKSLLHSLK